MDNFWPFFTHSYALYFNIFNASNHVYFYFGMNFPTFEKKIIFLDLNHNFILGKIEYCLGQKKVGVLSYFREDVFRSKISSFPRVQVAQSINSDFQGDQSETKR